MFSPPEQDNSGIATVLIKFYKYKREHKESWVNSNGLYSRGVKADMYWADRYLERDGGTVLGITKAQFEAMWSLWAVLDEKDS